MSTESPFTLKRFEYERTHLYYLPKQVFSRLEGKKTVYLIGSRGTGKTTLLNALNWEEQRGNQELKERLAEIKAGRGYVGLYVKVPETVAAAFERWMPTADETFRSMIFCLYLDLVWIQAALDATAARILFMKRPVTIASEHATTHKILDRFPELIVDSKFKEPLSIKAMSSLVYEKRRALERWCTAGIEPSREAMSKVLPFAQVGEVGRYVVGELVSFIEASANEEVHLKVCLDEAECLSTFQQRALNTVVRLATASLSFIVSYVRAGDVTNTIMEHISLQEADRDLIYLDQMGDAEFGELAEGVATVRLRRVTKDAPTFRTRDILGNLDINELLLEILQASAAPEAKKILRSAEQLAQTQYYVDIRDEEGPKSPPPIYQAYLIDRLDLQTPSPDSERWQRRRQHSAEIRKRMVIAYLCLCKELKTQVKYASADMLFQMSDKCIRDYLNQMDAIFEVTGKSVEQFCAATIPWDKQHSALWSASVRKKDAIPKSEVGAPIETLLLIDALGQLTARLQTTTTQNKSLRSSERGIFSVDKNALSTQSGQTLRLILEAAEAGFLKLLEDKNGAIRFRVHCSLAAAYGFSYRGAYYDSAIKVQDLKAFYDEKDEGTRNKRISALGDHLLQEPSTMPMFEN